MTGLVSWVFRSPRRLGLTGGALLIAIVVGGTVWSSFAPSRLDSATGVTAGTASAAGGGFGTAAPGGDEASRHYLSTAVTFATVWAQVPAGQSPVQWHAAVRALATQQLAQGLDTTDPSSLPGGAPANGASLKFVSDTSALVKVPLSSGTSILVTVVHAGDSWLVSNVQPDLGN